ncbi:MAG TPA: thioesterase family protein [Azospirillaceae bacterium]|nr:thioesterase family protein [Azospirillaceae bacterium]
MDTENGPGAHPAPDPTDPAIYRHWEAEHVRFSDLDPLGHANNNAIGVYMETGRLGFHRAVGAHRHVPGRVFVLARTVVDYRAEVLYPGDLRVGVRLVRVGRTSWTLGTGLFVGDRCAATGEAVIVLIDRETRRPSPLPDALRQALESLN